MAQNLLLALQITAIGMGLVFGSIILFWLLMAVMVRLTSEGLNHKGHEGLADAGHPHGGAPTPSNREPSEDTVLRRRAVVAAVAVALARQRGAAGLPARLSSPTAQASAWQVVQRAKSLRIFPRGRAR